NEVSFRFSPALTSPKPYHVPPTLTMPRPCNCTGLPFWSGGRVPGRMESDRTGAPAVPAAAPSAALATPEPTTSMMALRAAIQYRPAVRIAPPHRQLD